MRALLILLAGCALTSKAPVRELRYFAPPAHAMPAAHAQMEIAASVRLGRIAPGTLVRARILHRESGVEVAPYETLRWSDDPEIYVRRSVTDALFADHRVEQALASSAPTLDVEIRAFEEVRRGAQRLGHVELGYTLHDEERVLARGTVTVERPASGVQIEQVVEAIGAALDAATSELADRVVARLGVT